MIRIVIPKAYNLLRRLHINEDVKAKWKMLMDYGEALDVLMDAWGTIMDYVDYQSFDGFFVDFNNFVLLYSLSM